MFITFIKHIILLAFMKASVEMSHSMQGSHDLNKLCGTYMKNVQRTENKNYLALTRSTQQFPTNCFPPDLKVLQIKGMEPYLASCDSDVPGAGPGWTVIQRRIDGQVDFYRNWADYKEGFGNVEGEFWIGLEKLHLMTKKKRYELYIKLVDQNDNTRYARFDNFIIGSEAKNYTLVSVGKYSGNAKNSMGGHVGRQFSTKDVDNDLSKNKNCAAELKGAWWYFYCADSNLNGKRFDCNVEKSNKLEATGCIYWHHWHGRSHSLKNVQMMIRPFHRI